jgi:regulator of sirC expression with transglutaminase-like and TPR domain
VRAVLPSRFLLIPSCSLSWVSRTPAAAQAFERCVEADPRFAYAYYYAGLAYDRLNRADLMINRLEMFQRLAPEAPERPEVESILQTVRRR